MLVKSRVKYIQSLGQKRQRDIEGVFMAEGPKIVAELLASAKALIQQMFATKEWLQQHSQGLNGIEAIEVSEDELGKISQLATPNQVIAIVRQFDSPSFTAKDTVTLVLDTIQDPGNLGTIIRIADWFGIGQIVCSKDCADLYNPKVVQSTMGSVARVKVIYTDLAEWIAGQNVPVYAAALEGQDISTIKKIKEGILIVGNESKGISPDVMKLAKERITIVRKGEAESLNAAVATGIILSHLT
jgi:TrmH family RNA methyltransferase